MSTGCLAVGGSAAANAAVGDSPVRRLGGAFHIGPIGELAEERVFLQLQYTRDLGPLGLESNALGAWGARVSTIGSGRVPGFYVHGAYAQNNARSQPDATSIIAGIGLNYGAMVPGVRGRVYRAASAGLVFHRSHQATVDEGRAGTFLGIEVTFTVGFDSLGPLFSDQ
jgi:hypothetical protein